MEIGSDITDKREATARLQAALRENYALRVDPAAAATRRTLTGIRGDENTLLTSRVEVMAMRDRAAPRKTFVLARGADGAFELFEDDGKSFEYRRGGWMGIALKWADRDRRLSMALMPGSRMRPPLVRDVVVRVAGQAATQSVKFSGRAVSVKL